MIKVIVNMIVMMKKMPLSTLMFLKRHPGVCHAVCTGVHFSLENILCGIVVV